MSRFRSQITEVINRNSVVSLALAQGFNAYLPVYDGGVDFILYHEDDRLLRKVQLKARWTIDRKYIDRDIWIAFPIAGEWYLAPHEDLVLMGEAKEFTQSASWIEQGNYSLPRPSKAVVEACERYRFARIAEVSAKAADEA